MKKLTRSGKKKKLALAFKLATDENAELLASYLPEPDSDTGEIDPSRIPQSLPGYIIGLTAEFLEDGETLFEAAASNMGSEMIEGMHRALAGQHLPLIILLQANIVRLG